MRSVHIGCSRYSRRCHLLVALSFHRGWNGGQGKGAVAGTRRLAMLHATSFVLNYAAASLRLRVLCSGSYASQLIQR